MGDVEFVIVEVVCGGEFDSISVEFWVNVGIFDDGY